MSTSQIFKPGLVRCTCAWCSNEFWAKRRDAKYCSTSHKLKHQRWRGNLHKHQHEVLTRIENIASYLSHEDSKPTAAHELRDIKRFIDQMLYKAGIGEVK